MQTAKAISLARSHGGGFAVEILVNVALPFLIYTWLSDGWGDVDALIASSAPPLLWSVVGFARTRRIDAVSVMVLAGIGLSLLALIGGGSARFLQLRENLVTGLIGLVFVGSAAIGRPLIHRLARAGVARGGSISVTAFDEKRDDPDFRRAMTVMTLVWGFGLIAQTALACALVFMMPIATYLLVSPFVGYGSMAALAGWTYLYSRNRRDSPPAVAPDANGSPAP